MRWWLLSSCGSLERIAEIARYEIRSLVNEGSVDEQPDVAAQVTIATAEGHVLGVGKLVAYKWVEQGIARRCVRRTVAKLRVCLGELREDAAVDECEGNACCVDLAEAVVLDVHAAGA